MLCYFLDLVPVAFGDQRSETEETLIISSGHRLLETHKGRGWTYRIHQATLSGTLNSLMILLARLS